MNLPPIEMSQREQVLYDALTYIMWAGGDGRAGEYTSPEELQETARRAVEDFERMAR